MTVVNGDKPLVKATEDGIFAYGTPWAGKENLQTNMRTRLTDICFIHRSKQNSTVPMDKALAVGKLLSQIYLPKTDLAAENTLEMLNRLLVKCRVWEVNCTNDIEAAKNSYKAIFKEGEKNET